LSAIQRFRHSAIATREIETAAAKVQRMIAADPAGPYWFPDGALVSGGCTGSRRAARRQRVHLVHRAKFDPVDGTDRHARPDIAGSGGSLEADPDVMLSLAPVVLVRVVTTLRGERVLTAGHRPHHALHGVRPGLHGRGRKSRRVARIGPAFGSERMSRKRAYFGATDATDVLPAAAKQLLFAGK